MNFEQLKNEMEILLKMAGLGDLYEVTSLAGYSVPVPIYNPKKIRFSWADAVHTLKHPYIPQTTHKHTDSLITQTVCGSSLTNTDSFAVLDSLDRLLFDLLEDFRCKPKLKTL